MVGVVVVGMVAGRNRGGCGSSWYGVGGNGGGCGSSWYGGRR